MSDKEDIVENDDDFEIEVVDDTPEEDRGRPRRPDGVEPEIPEDDEIAGYSETVQKRIKKLKYEFHEERRQKEAAQREKDEAIAAAKRAHDEAIRLRQTVSQGEVTLVDQAKRRVEVQLAAAQKAYKDAYESGDADALLKAQNDLTELKHEELRLKAFKPQKPAEAPQTQSQQAPAQPQKPSVPKPSPRAEDWAAKNPWFGRSGDEDMTAQAFVAHERAIREGVAPDSEEYYNRIDRSVRSMFADRFSDADTGQQQQRQKVGVVVAPAGRTSGQNQRKVTLTQTQVSIAKRLGLTPQQYAAQLLKEQKNG